MLKKIGAVAALVALAACSGGAGSGTSAVPGTRGELSKVVVNWQSLDSQTVQPSGANLAAFGFAVKTNSRLLVTQNDPTKNPYLGNHAGQTISATVHVDGVNPGATFTYSGEGTTSNPCGTPASVRLFFTSTGGPFAYTQYWWSDVPPGSAQLDALMAAPQNLTATLDPATPWSDWNGQPSAAHAAEFTAAASNITSIGLSFGGGCFFENGVGTSDGSGVFTLQSFSESGTR
jgi:hypothetical protein